VAYAIGEDRSDFQAGGQSWSANSFGFTKFTEAADWKSSTARGNWARMKSQGVHRGAYHFFHPAVSATAQASWFLNYVKACGGWEPGDMFACDIEISSGEDGMEQAEPQALARMHRPLMQAPAELMGASVNSGALGFCNAVAAAVGPSCPVILYTYMSFRSLVTGCTRYPLWIADYAASPPSSVSPWKTWTFWQNADHGGQGGGDTDRFCGNAGSLSSWISSHGASSNWTEKLVQQLPTLEQGNADQVGQNQIVGKMQALLAFVGTKNNLPAAASLTADGQFGPATLAALEAVQAFFNITGANGQCGQRTWEYLLLATDS
jgi:GH25 family lysozyme M1 (1,4-beta-N-acetylmuramidase)